MAMIKRKTLGTRRRGCGSVSRNDKPADTYAQKKTESKARVKAASDNLKIVNKEKKTIRLAKKAARQEKVNKIQRYATSIGYDGPVVCLNTVSDKRWTTYYVRKFGHDAIFSSAMDTLSPRQQKDLVRTTIEVLIEIWEAEDMYQFIEDIRHLDDKEKLMRLERKYMDTSGFSMLDWTGDVDTQYLQDYIMGEYGWNAWLIYDLDGKSYYVHLTDMDKKDRDSRDGVEGWLAKFDERHGTNLLEIFGDEPCYLAYDWEVTPEDLAVYRKREIKNMSDERKLGLV